MGTFFNNMYEITYYIPEITKKIGILDSNKKFIVELFGHSISEGKEIEINEGNISFNDVSYSYEKDIIDAETSETSESSKLSRPSIVIDHLTTSIKSKELVAIYGPSGSGKTTFIKLILNILKPQTGIISIDNYDLKTVSNKSLKKYISYVSQNKVSLFEKSILENLTYGYYDVDDTVNRIKILISKYKLGQIFVNINKDMELKTDMVDEYGFLNYNVGKHGNMLSGGQRQIIHIIRAVLNKSSKIMILDEPTTALDNISRDNVIRMIKENCGMKTVLIITHDEAIKKMCNSVIKFG
jgi:ABC-type multidrug transport system fused ATPase/permease subunit